MATDGPPETMPGHFRISLGADSRSDVALLRAQFPDLRFRAESGFGFLEALGTLIVPTVALAVAVLQYVDQVRKKKSSSISVLKVSYRSGSKEVVLEAAGDTEAVCRMIAEMNERG